jgi:hypothetical protein
MASVVKGLGRGGAAWTKRELGWDPTTRRKGLSELEAGFVAADSLHLRGRKGFCAKLPKLHNDLRSICEANCQTDPTFRTTVAKTKPLRKIPETDEIFEKVHEINAQADADPGIVHLSIDTKTTVPIGNLSRGEKSRLPTQALDHDLEPEAKSSSTYPRHQRRQRSRKQRTTHPVAQADDRILRHPPSRCATRLLPALPQQIQPHRKSIRSA